MAYNNLLISQEEMGICVLQIHRPQALNALNPETLNELKQALEEIGKNPKIRVLVLTGSGEKAFIAGADIKAMQNLSRAEGMDFAHLGQTVTKLLEVIPQPCIAAVNGFALGGGTEMAIACDFIIASENAVFGQPEVGLGIIPGFGATLRLARFVGWPRAKELIYSGRRIKAAEALKMGLVNQVYPQADLMKEVMELAKKISAQSAMAVSRCKNLMNQFSDSGLDTFAKLNQEAVQFSTLFGSNDQREGMTAFVEKRGPKFEGM